jgi:FKBP-type peptidyl-prolyl cis-trans isomerase (trigger factor)
MEKSYVNLKKLSNKNGDIEFQAEVPIELIEDQMMEVLADIALDFTAPGFRKGKVPETVVREHVGEMSLLENAANDLLRNAMSDIAKDEKLDVVGRPEVIVTKMAPKNPLEFRVRYALMPDITLPDYKKIGKTIFERKDPIEVTEAEIDEAIARIQNMFTPPSEAGKAPEPLTDETVKMFGNFNNIAEFRVELKRQLTQEKELHMKDGRREEMIKEIVKKTKIEVPKLLVEQELFEFVNDRDEQLKTANLTLEEYLKQIGKTAEALEKDERALIESDLQMRLTVQEIRKQENIVAEDRAIHIMIAELKLRYPERSEETLHRTAEAMIIQDKLFAILEGSKLVEAKADDTARSVEKPEVTE